MADKPESLALRSMEQCLLVQGDLCCMGDVWREDVNNQTNAIALILCEKGSMG